MSEKLSEPKAKTTIGTSGIRVGTGHIRADEFLTNLKGRRAIEVFREMRDNDATIGAVMYATEQVLRDVPFEVVPVDESDEAIEAADFVRSVFEDMEHTLDDHISEALSSLSYGFSLFEVVYKRRVGPNENSPKKRSRFTDNYIGVRKLASRAQWSIIKFDFDENKEYVVDVHQQGGVTGRDIRMPMNKLLHYRTTTQNNDPSGRSILRNAYKSYTYLTNLQQIEAYAIEREMHGIPVGRIPVEYLSTNATEDQVAFRKSVEKALRDVKLNEQGYLLVPSDPYTDADGKPTNLRLVDIELITADGNRSVDIDPVIKRYQHDIARSVMAEFLMLGGSSSGSYALSKSKTDLFLRALESYINSIFDVLNQQLIEPLWRLNGFDYNLMPRIEAGDVAPHDLKELGSYLRNLNGADINLSDQVEIVDALLTNAELPRLNREVYAESQERKRVTESARNDYYDGPDDNVTNPDGVDSGETE